MTIPPLPHGVADYVAAFDLASVAVTRDPTGYEAAWWCSAKQASAIVRQGARRDRNGSASCQRETLSISVGSSSGARELLTRFETGHFCSTSPRAGLSNSIPALPVSHGS